MARTPGSLVQYSALSLLCAALCFALPAAAQSPETAVGAEGEVYSIHQGAYGELFPGVGLVPEENSVLALEIARQTEPSELILVPGTESADEEDSASLLFEDDTETLFVLWQTKKNLIHSWLNLSGYSEGTWTEVAEITGNPFGWKSSPQLEISRDSFHTEEPDGTLRTWKRTVAHLIWWEESLAGPEVFYSPVVLIDGSYIGWNPVYKLEDLVAATAGPAPREINLPLAEATKVEAGKDRQSVVVGFVHKGTGEVISLSIDTIPGELSYVADKIRNQIIDVGRTLFPDQPSALADKVRNQIIDVGLRCGMHPAIATYAADQAQASVAAASPRVPIESLADDIRNQIIDVGARLPERGIGHEAAISKIQVVEVERPATGGSAANGSPTNLIRVIRAATRATPETGTTENHLYLSPSGEDALVAWSEDGQIFYRESRGEGWSTVRRLGIGVGVDQGLAWKILETRAHERVPRN